MTSFTSDKFSWRIEQGDALSYDDVVQYAERLYAEYCAHRPPSIYPLCRADGHFAMPDGWCQCGAVYRWSAHTPKL